MELTLSAQEQQVLEAILEARYRVLQKEIAHTDHREFKSVLAKLRVGSMAKAS